MDIGAIFLLLALVVVVAAFVYRPFRDGGPEVWVEDIELSELQAERERILDALVELEFDNELGKVPEEIFEPQRKNLLTAGAKVLKQLEEEYQTGDGGDEIEAQVAARRRRVTQIADLDDPLEQMIRQRRSAASKSGKQTVSPAGSQKFCPECGEAIKTGDRFCPSCGTKL